MQARNISCGNCLPSNPVQDFKTCAARATCNLPEEPVMNHLDPLMLATPNFRSTAAVHSPSPRSNIDGAYWHDTRPESTSHGILVAWKTIARKVDTICGQERLDGLRIAVARQYEEVGGHQRNGLILVSSISGLVILASLRLREEVENKKKASI